MKKNNLNTIIGMLIIFGIMIGWFMFTKPSKEEIAEMRRVDSLRKDSIYKAFVKDSILKAEALALKELDTVGSQQDSLPVVENENLAPANDSVSQEITQKRNHYPFGNASIGDTGTFFVKNQNLLIEFNPWGGNIASVQLLQYRTYDTLPLILFNPETSDLGFHFFADGRRFDSRKLLFEAKAGEKTIQIGDSILVEDQDIKIQLRLYADLNDTLTDPNKYIEYEYVISPDKYMLDYTIRYVGMNELLGENINFLLNWKTRIKTMEKSVENERNATTIYYRDMDEDVDYISERKDGEEDINTTLNWISFKQQFFSSTFIAKEGFVDAFIQTQTEEIADEKYVKTLIADIEIPFNKTEKEEHHYALYYGPNKFRTLRDYKLDLERQIPLGWSFAPLAWINRIFVIPVFDYLEQKHFNYGIIILIITILLKIVLFPIAYRTYRSSAKMRVLRPEIDEIGKKFPKKEDAMKKQQATMALYKKAGVNPMAGCVPMLLQMPILIALFRFFPASIELRQKSFLWAEDLSTYDSILDLGFNIPFYGDHVSLFTLLMTITTLIYTRVNNQMMGANNSQMPGMKMMMYMMPVMFLGFFNSYAAALSYYYFLANIITFLQMFLIRRFINEDKLRAQIAANKTKPKKQSNFQKRLENMAKQRGYQPKR